ncbi:helix-turn-helix domain-containing protein [Eubacteriales bacterium OttesenSCG-928-A19]|nr:helix-turn-helix domain-containing protein [Eubacteriales bacterium OttesenSCG-928-A19]
MTTARSRHGVFIRYLCMFLIVLILPVGMLAVSAFSNMRAALWKEMESAQQAAVRQVTFVLEQYTTGMYALAKQLMTDPEVRAMATLIDSDKSTLAKAAGVRKLNAFRTPNPFISRIMVANGDTLLSTEGVMLEHEARAIRRMLAERGGEQFVYRPDLERNFIYYIRSLSFIMDSNQYLICEIPRSIFSKFVQALPHAEVTKTMILEGDTNPIFYNTGSAEDLLPFTTQAHTGRWDEVDFEGAPYYLYRQKLDQMDLSMLVLLPRDVLSAPLNQTLLIIGLYVLMAVALGVGMSLWFAYRNYKPIQRMLQSTPQQDERPLGAWNGLKALSDVYDRTIEDNLMLKRRVQQQHVYTARHFLINLLRGKYGEETDISALAAQFNISFSSPLFRVVMVQLRPVPGGAWTAHGDGDSDRIQEIIGRAFSTGCQYTLLVMEPDCFVAVLNYAGDELSDAMLAFCAQQAIHNLREELPAHVTLGISEEKTSLPMLYKAYNEAENACEYRLIRGNNTAVFASEVGGLMTDVSLRYMQAFKNQAELEKHLGDGNFAAIEHSINRLFQDIQESDISIGLARCIYYEIINMVMRTLPYAFVKKLSLTDLMQAGTLDNLRQHVLTVYKQACDGLHRKSAGADPAEMAVAYIRTHHTRPDLSLEMTAGALGFSRSYLSRVFSDRMQMTFVEYVHRTRVDEACVLLKDGNLPVIQIARQVGYQDLHTFLRNFKKIMGMTPTQLRETSLREASLREKRGAAHIVSDEEDIS